MLGYFERSKGYKVYNTETRIVEESINVRFDDKLGPQKSKQKDSLAGIEIQFTGSEDGPYRSSEETTKDRSSKEETKDRTSDRSVEAVTKDRTSEEFM